MIFDTHCHLNHPDLYQQIDDVMKHAKDVGVTKFLVVGWDKETSLLAIKIAEQYDNVYAAIGFHPTEVYELSEKDYLEVMSNISHPKVVAVGEIGLDYHWEKDKNKQLLQQKWFKKQIIFANENHKPVIIHNRDAFLDCLDILKEVTPTSSGVMHCFSGSVEFMHEVLKLGLYIGLDGPLTFTNAKTPKEVCKAVPLDKLLVETDSPYLAPHPLRGTMNEPKNNPLIIQEMAKIKELSVKEIEHATFDNACKLFHV